MHYKTFDTHKYIKNLQETGFNERQAEVLVKSLLESRDFDLSILATREQVSKVKSDLQQEISATRAQIAEVKSDLQQEISQLDNKLSGEISATRAQIAEVKVDILKWMIPLMFTIIALVASLMIKLF